MCKYYLNIKISNGCDFAFDCMKIEIKEANKNY